MADTKIAIIETEVLYIKKGVDEINRRLKEGDDANREMLKAINENRNDINLLKHNCSIFEKKIEKVQGEVELVNGKHTKIQLFVSKIYWKMAAIAGGAGVVGGMLAKFIIPIAKSM